MMELTIEEVLQRGIAAHREGKLQDAERLYRAILRSQPAHPDANHNLGVLAVSVNKVGEAIPLFKAALESNQKIEQFWLSYIDALIKGKQFDNAKQALEQAKTQDVDLGRLNSSETQLTSINKQETFSRVRPSQEQLSNLLKYYQNGRLDDAERLAVHITQEFPKHQFAWKVLGAVLGTTGRKSEAVDANQTAVALSPQDAESHSNLGVNLQELGRLDEAEAFCRQAIALKPQYSEAHYNLGVTLKEQGRLDEAEASYYHAIALKPQYSEAYFNLGNTLQEQGRLDEAEASYNQVIALKPDLVESHYNLANTLLELGRLDEAEAGYNQTIALKPDYAEAHNNLGNTLQELDRLDDAVESYNQAIALKPKYAEAHSNLGNTLKELERLDEAVASYSQAVALKPDLAEAYINLGIAINNVRFNSSRPELYLPLTQLLTTGNYTRPSAVAKGILSLLKHDTQIKDLLLEKTSPVSLKEATSIVASLDKVPLLHHLMRLCPLPDLQFEKFFVMMRRLLLKNLDKMEVSPELIYFFSTLSLHCFVNEYVYIESDEETHLIGELEANISQIVAQSEQPEAIKVLCLASFRPLHHYDWCQTLESLDNLEEVKRRLIDEPLLEKIIAKDIPVLQEISDDISLKVKEQYEENPYPRWMKTVIPAKAKSITAVCDELDLQLHAKDIKDVTAPAILIAGCGTGQHAIGTASRFSNCHVTAIDLSLASLAYAQRKSNEMGFNNIDYLQADILHLHQMSREFDIIESAGVLHHMDEPMVGWRVLTDLLKPGGLMNIGLYSEMARHDIAEIREEITVLGVGTSEAAIRKFRHSLVGSHSKTHQRLTMWDDFFSLSTMRDLIFHAQEHRFTLPQIKNCLDGLGLKFCGFETRVVTSKFREIHRDGSDIYDIELWHQYEERSPRAFAGMYQFWCQKL